MKTISENPGFLSAFTENIFINGGKKTGFFMSVSYESRFLYEILLAEEQLL
ncbi:Uncharacterized protein dnm_045920 [Desulfonema magnum]|uniref:Uncharacterized protein n=1 Tax=Desulfonema magnum TaxID=45655 RepID=A0A975BN22_9BACT|nr:Uncharacterized protein dnm_045920 [Desulfonema magnum]